MLSGQEGPGAFSGEREPGGEGPRAEPERALPAPRAVWPMKAGEKPKKHWLTFDRRLLLMALFAGLPGVLISILLLWRGEYLGKVQWTLALVIVGVWLGCAFALRERVVYPLQTLSNLLAALREGDFSIRARGASREDPMREVMLEVNALGTTLREQRLGALEATALLRRVMEEIDVAVFTFDGEKRLRLVNRAGERLLVQPAERLLGRKAEELGLAGAPRADRERTRLESRHLVISYSGFFF